MSYSIHKGPFYIGLITSSKTTSTTETTLSIDEFRTSYGKYPFTSLNITGLAYSDLTSNRGFGARPYGEHTAKSGAGYGTDVSRGFGGKGCGGSIGCAFLSNDPVLIRY